MVVLDEDGFGGDSPLDWYSKLPPVTRAYLTAIFIVSVATSFGYITPLQLYFHQRLIFSRHQWWRLITPFLYFGPVNFDFVFHMFFLLRYCRVLEEENYHGRPADFIWMIVFGAACMLVIGSAIKATFLSTSLTFMLVYIWSRRNPGVLMNFLGVFNFNAPLMPWVLLAFSLMMTGNLPVSDIIGIAVGHVYFYLVDVYPRLYRTRSPLETPYILKLLMRQPDREFVLPEQYSISSENQANNNSEAEGKANMSKETDNSEKLESQLVKNNGIGATTNGLEPDNYPIISSTRPGDSSYMESDSFDGGEEEQEENDDDDPNGKRPDHPIVRRRQLKNFVEDSDNQARLTRECDVK